MPPDSSVAPTLIRRIDRRDVAAFDGLAAIYGDVFPPAERKPKTQLLEMLNDADYHFFVGERGDDVLSFAILKTLGDDLVLLEYMGVRRALSGLGEGGRMFKAVTGDAALSTSTFLLEVEDDAEVGPTDQKAMRKRFYRRLGCVEAEGLGYAMPRVSKARPPPMNLLVYRQPPLTQAPKLLLRRWLTAIYVKVYGRPADDPELDRMTKNLPRDVSLI